MYVCKDSTCICKHALNRDAFFWDKMGIQLQRPKYTYVCENFLKLLVLIGECRHRLLDFADIHM